MELAQIFNDKEPNKIYGIMGNINLTTNNNNYSIIDDYKYKTNVKEFLNDKKDVSSLQMVMLDESYLDKSINELSEIEIRKINLAKALINNKKYLAFDYFEKGLSHKEKENFKRLFKKLAYDYHKTIILLTNDITFLWDIADYILYVDNKEVINTYSKSNYFQILSLIDKPEITKFIDLMKAKGLVVENYKNVLDLLKAIYRLKE